MQDASYLNIDTGERETVFFFMLNAYLLSRIDTEHESTEDKEVSRLHGRLAAVSCRRLLPSRSLRVVGDDANGRFQQGRGR